MIWLRIGSEYHNLALVVKFRETAGVDDPAARRIELHFMNGAVEGIEGEEALRLRRYLITNSASLGDEPGPTEFAIPDAVLLPHPDRGEQGA